MEPTLTMHDVRCGNCGLPAETKCSRCKLVRYCNKECQKKHWKRQHKRTCVPHDGGSDPDQDDPDNLVQVVNTDDMTLQVQVRKSGNHGHGVFANADIAKGTKVCFYDGDLKDSKVNVKMRKAKDGTLSIVDASDYFRMSMVPDPDYDRIMAHPNPKMNGYVVVGRTDLQPADQPFPDGFGVGQFVNDGCKPNLSADETDFVAASKALNDYQAASLKAMNCEVDRNFWFVASRDIKAGEELLTHYGFEFWVHKLMLLSKNPNSVFLLYSLHEQTSKPFNLRQFFDYDSDTIKAFLVDMCGLPTDTVANYKSPKDLMFELMEKVNIMNPSTFG